MDKKVLALIIIVLAVVSIYGLFYAFVTAVLLPQDLNSYNNELNAMPPSSSFNETINELESQASIIESVAPLNYLSQEERISMANTMRNGISIPPEILSSNWTQYKQYSDARAFKYDLIFNSKISSKMRNISTNYEEISNMSSQIISTQQKMSNDFEKGDNKAYADDLRTMARTIKEYNNAMQQLRINLQSLVKDLRS